MDKRNRASHMKQKTMFVFKELSFDQIKRYWTASLKKTKVQHLWWLPEKHLVKYNKKIIGSSFYAKNSSITVLSLDIENQLDTLTP